MSKQNELIAESYEKIYTTAVSITKAFNSEHIPLTTLYQLTTKSKLNKPKKLDKEFVTNYNKTIDMLYQTCLDWCKANELGTKMPMIVLRVFIDGLKGGLK